MAVVEKGLTLAEFLEFSEQKPAVEFVDGEVSHKVSPQGKHSVLQKHLVVRLDQAGTTSRVATAFQELRTTFAGRSLVPDVSVYRSERIPRDAGGEVADRFAEPPDIAIEIVSPGQSANALVRRCLWYVANGVQIALLVDPADRSVLAFRPGQPAVAWRGDDAIDLVEILPDFKLAVEELFSALKLT